MKRKIDLLIKEKEDRFINFTFFYKHVEKRRIFSFWIILFKVGVKFLM